MAKSSRIDGEDFEVAPGRNPAAMPMEDPGHGGGHQRGFHGCLAAAQLQEFDTVLRTPQADASFTHEAVMINGMGLKVVSGRDPAAMPGSTWTRR